MALPMILSLLGSTAAGAGMLGAMSPLLAGALGSGIGTAIETGDIGKGLSAGLTSGLLGGIGGRLVGNLAGNAATQTATGALTTNPAAAAAGAAGQEAAKQGILGGLLGNMQTGLQPGVVAADATMGQKLMQGLGGAGAMSGAGLGTMLGAGMLMEPPGPKQRERTEQATPSNRERFAPPADFRAGYDPEFAYFSPQVPPAIRFQEGGPVSAAPGIAGMAAPSGAENDKVVVARAAQAIEGRLPEADAARALGAFLQRFGEQALRQLARDVTSGRGPRGGDADGPVRGPGDGMSDTVPARMDDGSQDVLLSDGEFVVPADVVSGLGNGSTDAGVSELEDMMSRVRRERTGKARQPEPLAAGGVLPA